jgi:hypothetical protein
VGFFGWVFYWQPCLLLLGAAVRLLALVPRHRQLTFHPHKVLPPHRIYIIYRKPVLRIRDVIPDPGSECYPFRIPDPNVIHSGSRIQIFFPLGSRTPDPHQKKFKYFNPKNWFLSSRKYDPGYSSQIWILFFYLSLIPDPGAKKAPDPGSGCATMTKIIQKSMRLNS